METILLLLAEARPGSAHPPGEWLVSIRQVRAVAMTTAPPPLTRYHQQKSTHFPKCSASKVGNVRKSAASTHLFHLVDPNRFCSSGTHCRVIHYRQPANGAHLWFHSIVWPCCHSPKYITSFAYGSDSFQSVKFIQIQLNFQMKLSKSF